MSLYVKNLDYQIGNDQILKQISLEIRDGEFVGLVGPNGCGKSTLLKHIYRTYKPKGGTIFLDGKDITEFSAKKMAGELAVMAQENQLEFDFTVRDMVMFGREIKWLSYVFSALLTIFFSIIVNLVMYRKLKKISMVESMKSTE